MAEFQSRLQIYDKSGCFGCSRWLTLPTDFMTTTWFPELYSLSWKRHRLEIALVAARSNRESKEQHSVNTPLRRLDEAAP